MLRLSDLGKDATGYRRFDVDLSGRIALVTGANSGMGKETAREMARMGAQVILGCRSTVRGEAARREIIETTGSSGVTVMEVDLSSLASVRAFARAFDERFAKLDVLVNNAAASVLAREITPEGFERHWATNVLGPRLLTRLLLPALQAEALQRDWCLPGIKAGQPDAHLGAGRQAPRQPGHGQRAEPRVRDDGPDTARRRPCQGRPSS